MNSLGQSVSWFLAVMVHKNLWTNKKCWEKWLSKAPKEDVHPVPSEGVIPPLVFLLDKQCLENSGALRGHGAVCWLPSLWGSQPTFATGCDCAPALLGAESQARRG